MAFENVKCFGCQQYGHLERDCPDKNYATELGDGDKPPWCQQCDRETRLVYFMTPSGIPDRPGYVTARRCTACHPSGHLLAAQFKRCKQCRSVIYEWDSRSECGSHQPVGEHLEVDSEWRDKCAQERKSA